MFERGKIRRLALALVDAGRIREAAREYGRLTETDPRELHAVHTLVSLSRKAGDRVAEANAEAVLAERLEGQRFRLGAIYHHRRVLELTEVLPPEHRQRHRASAPTVARLQSEVAEARGKLAVHDAAAQALEREGRDLEVLPLLHKMIALEQDNPVFHARLAEANCRLSRLAEALPSFHLAASTLVHLGRPRDALRVLERILHLQMDPEASRLAAELYLERGEPDDALRAVSKLSPWLKTNPEDLDALLLLARAFEAMGQPARATQVRAEALRVSRAEGELDLERLLASRDGSPGAGLSSRPASPRDASSAPGLSVRSFVVTEEELEELEELEDDEGSSESSILEEISFEELDEEWVMPVMSREARRALDEAQAFIALRLYRKAEYVLRQAKEQDPFCAELRETLRSVSQALGDGGAFVEETVALADLYRQRRFFERAAKVLHEALAVDPGSEPALQLMEAVEASSPGASAPRH